MRNNSDSESLEHGAEISAKKRSDRPLRKHNGIDTRAWLLWSDSDYSSQRRLPAINSHLCPEEQDEEGPEGKEVLVDGASMSKMQACTLEEEECEGTGEGEEETLEKEIFADELNPNYNGVSKPLSLDEADTEVKQAFVTEEDREETVEKVGLITEEFESNLDAQKQRLETAYIFSIPYLLENMESVKSYCDILHSNFEITTSELEQIRARETTQGKESGVKKLLTFLLNKQHQGIRILHDLFMDKNIGQDFIKCRVEEAQPGILEPPEDWTSFLDTMKQAVVAILDGTDKELVGHLNAVFVMNGTCTNTMMSRLRKFGNLSSEEHKLITDLKGASAQSANLYDRLVEKKNGSVFPYIIMATSENTSLWKDIKDVINMENNTQSKDAGKYLVYIKTKQMLEKSNEIYTPDVFKDEIRHDEITCLFRKYKAEVRDILPECVAFIAQFTTVPGLLQCWADCYNGVFGDDLSKIADTPGFSAEADDKKFRIEVVIPEEQFLHALIHLLSQGGGETVIVPPQMRTGTQIEDPTDTTTNTETDGIVVTTQQVEIRRFPSEAVRRETRGKLLMAEPGRELKDLEKRSVQSDTGDSSIMYDVFILVSKDDSGFARLLVEELETTHGLRCATPERDFIAGIYIIENIFSALANSQYVIAVLSKNSVEDDWLNFGLQMACTNFLYEGQEKKVVPIIIDDLDMSKEKKIRALMDPGILLYAQEANFTEKLLYALTSQRESVPRKLGLFHRLRSKLTSLFFKAL